MLLGEKDDNLPVAKVEGYLAFASGAGHPVPRRPTRRSAADDSG
jgi:hypothetical protein